MRALALVAALLVPALLSAQPTISARGNLTQCTTSTSCEIPVPANNSGDLIIVIAMASAGGSALTINVDETDFGGGALEIDSNNTVGTDTYATAEMKVSGGSEPANATVTSSVSGTIIGRAYTLTGVHADVVDATTQLAVADDNTDSFTTPPITTATGIALVWSCVHKEGGHGGSITQPSGYTVELDFNSATQTGNPRIGCAVKLVASPGTETPGAWSGITGGGADFDGWTMALKAAVAAAGEFDVTPSVASQTATAYTITGSLDAAGDVSGVACAKDSTAPTIAQVIAGDCTGDVNALATDTDSPSTGNFDLSLTLTLTNDFPVADLYVTDGTNLTTLADEVLDCAAGQVCQYPLASVVAGGFFDDAGAVAGDYASIVDATDPDAFPTTLGTDGTVSYPDDTARQLIQAWLYDVSTAMLDELLFVFNNLAPALEQEWPLEDALYEIGVNPAFSSEDYVDDPEADDMTWTVESGALPDDWSLNADTGAISDGDPGVCGDFTFTLRATDIYNGTLDLPSTVNVGARIPDVEDDDEATAIAAIEALCSLVVSESIPRCSSEIAEGNVIGTEPPISTLVRHDAGVGVVVSSGGCESNRSRRNLPPGRRNQ